MAAVKRTISAVFGGQIRNVFRRCRTNGYMKNPIRTGSITAIAAASLFAAACGSKTPAPAAPATMEKTAAIACMGINACKAQGSCKSEKNACKGQNECKGQGIMEASAEDCATKGGTVAAMPTM
jgi:hypothetical protein